MVAQTADVIVYSDKHKIRTELYGNVGQVDHIQLIIREWIPGTAETNILII